MAMSKTLGKSGFGKAVRSTRASAPADAPIPSAALREAVDRAVRMILGEDLALRAHGSGDDDDDAGPA